MQNSKLKIKNWALLFCIFNFAFLIASCGGVPNLEAPECAEARGVVKELYSYHFGNEMRFSPENLKQREKFLTPEFYQSLAGLQTENDVLTTGDTDYPKAFRVGKCDALAPDRANVEVLLFWKTDTRTEQRAISVEVVKRNDKWLVNKILN